MVGVCIICMYHFAAPNNAKNQPVIPKYLYIKEAGAKLGGLDDNATGTGLNSVLTAVLEW